MSTGVTVTRTITTSDPNAIIINTGYVKVASGLLKLLQLVNKWQLFFHIKKWDKSKVNLISSLSDPRWHRHFLSLEELFRRAILSSRCKLWPLLLLLQVWNIHRSSFDFAYFGNGILHPHCHFAIVLPFFVEHRWIDFQNTLC